jgi:hypothetical protein
VLEALDALLVALRESSERNQVETRRAQTVRRLRSHRRTYGEILGRVAGSLTCGITRESATALVGATERLHVAQVKALNREGMGSDEIAVLCGLSPHDVATILSGAVSDDQGSPGPTH